ncbi:MAG: type II toxin-antitoxin system VapC family toxin [bacterium]|nr:type II toxin-antitoxin system VapC family toxin [bacterium]
MPTALYLDTSAVLRATFESGTTPELEAKIRQAAVLITSRLSLVESARAVHRLRALGEVEESRIEDLEGQIDEIWAHCQIWELTPNICDLASSARSRRVLRTLDALHLATFLHARESIDELELVTTDERLSAAANMANMD